MAYEELLIHACDIYHLRGEVIGGSYGVPETTEYVYEDLPDQEAVSCYWYKQSLRLVQGEPGTDFVELWTVQFPIEIDIRENDKLVFRGVSYKTHIPEPIREHHWEVTVERDDLL